MDENRKNEYRPIGACGIIGNMLSAALVSLEGAIDWCCLPRFDSPSVFAALLDSRKGGSFQIRPSGEFIFSQEYIEGTNILRTLFETP
jgi:GH15 family glucan-1,4-alpha-glucosidase